ncbi:MAG: MarR family transcriptional regulator [Candidatus Doudnabacteria bacterium]|nr:MarR family transcriptional regulator [Candidatus Doudnabacteria bacterium]
MGFIEDAENIRDMLIRLSRKSRRDLKKRLAVSGIGIMPLSYNLLALLADRDLTLREIAAEMEINPPTLVSAVDVLERKHFLKRTLDARDRRRTPLKITDSGRGVLKRVPKVAKADAFALDFGKLSKAQQVELRGLLKKLLS